MKKIVHIMISAFYKEGAGYQENLMSRAHKRMGLDVTIITSQFCLDNSGKVSLRSDGTYINADGIKVIILRNNKRYPLLSPFQNRCNGLKEVLTAEHPDCIFMHNIEYMDSYVVAKYAASHNIPLYCDNHADYYNTPLRSISDKILRRIQRIPLANYVAKRSIKIWGTTPWRVQYLQDYYKISPDKTDFLVLGADETLIRWDDRQQIREEVRLKYHIAENDFLIITGGKINKEKNIHLLAKAVSELPIDNLKLLIFGEPDEAVATYLSECDEKKVLKIGWVNSNDVYDLYLASDLGFFPGTHSVLWEQAVACGLPAVFKLWDGMKHVNVNGNAILLEDVTVSAIKNTITQIISTDLYAQMQDAAVSARSGFMYCDIAKKAIGL